MPDAQNGRNRENSLVLPLTASTNTVAAPDVVRGRATSFPLKDGHKSNIRYGFCGWKPKFLQCLNTPVWLLVFMSSANAIRSMLVSGLMGTVVTTLERRFGITSSQSSWIVSTYDISALPMLLIVSYIGSRIHRTIWTAVGLTSIALGSLVFTSPHFLTSPYSAHKLHVSDNDTGICDMSGDSDNSCDTDEGGVLHANAELNMLVLFIVGRMLNGLGAVPLYTICVTFLDDMVSKDTFSFYIGIFYGSEVIGLALGYMLGGFMLTIWGEVGAETDLTFSDPQWVGAWWPPFVLGAFVLLLIVIPMAGYTRDMPGSAEVRANKKSEAYTSADNDDSEEEEEVVEKDRADSDLSTLELKTIIRHFSSLARNPTYCCLTLFISLDWIVLGGFATFGPKYVEKQFSQSAAFSGMLFGAIAVTGGVSGTVIGGLLVQKLKLTCSGIMKWEVIFSTVTIFFAGMFWIVCEPIQLAGVHQSYEGFTNLTQDIQMLHPCNELCRCENSTFEPICDSQTATQYFSPCHAGCLTSKMNDQDTTKFYNCTCIQHKYTLNNLTSGADWAASTELCSASDGCVVKMCLWLVLMFCAMVLLFACASMNISATVRCVTPHLRSLAIGVQLIIEQLLGRIPGPIIFGQIFSASCVYSDTSCEQHGSCLAYDNARIALFMFILCVGSKGISLTSVSIAWKLYKPPRKIYKLANTEMKALT